MGTLRNEDFRQLLTKKVAQTSANANGAPQTQPTHSFSHRQAAEFVISLTYVFLRQ